MSIIEKDELILGLSLINPKLFFNLFVNEIYPDIRLSRDYQDKILDLMDCRDKFVVQAGRGVGKTVCLVMSILCDMISNPGVDGLVTTPSLYHLTPIFNKLFDFLYGSKIFRYFVKRAIRSPEYEILFINGSHLYGRIGGLGATKGTGVLGLHVDFLYVDEAQLYRGHALEQLHGCMKPGCKVRVFGVPNGLRDSYLIKMREDPKIPSFAKLKISRFQDPNFTKEEQEKLIRLYGGENTAAWRNQVLGEDDIAQRSTFNPRFFVPCFVDISGFYWTEFNGQEILEKEIVEDRDIYIPEIPEKCRVYISADIGYDPDPTEICIFYRTDKDISYLIARYTLRSISFSKQTRIIDYLATALRAEAVSIDVGGPGLSIALDLQNEELYPTREYSVCEVNFSSTIPVGVSPDGNIIKEKAKFYSTLMIQRAFQRRKLMLPSEDEALYNEIISSTQIETSEGKFTYAGPDHILDAIRCYMLTDLLIKEFEVPESSDDVVIVEF